MSVWEDPKHLDSAQQYLFKTSTDEVLAGLGISRDEATRWFHNGWLSFSVSELSDLDNPLEVELCFIASVARSGLSDAFIAELLGQLTKPYRYEPDSIAYSFSHGWVSTPKAREPFEIVDESIDDWLASLAEQFETDRLQELHDYTAELLKDAGNDHEVEEKA